MFAEAVIADERTSDDPLLADLQEIRHSSGPPAAELHEQHGQEICDQRSWRRLSEIGLPSIREDTERERTETTECYSSPRTLVLVGEADEDDVVQVEEGLDEMPRRCSGDSSATDEDIVMKAVLQELGGKIMHFGKRCDAMELKLLSCVTETEHLAGLLVEMATEGARREKTHQAEFDKLCAGLLQVERDVRSQVLEVQEAFEAAAEVSASARREAAARENEMVKQLVKSSTDCFADSCRGRFQALERDLADLRRRVQQSSNSPSRSRDSMQLARTAEPGPAPLSDTIFEESWPANGKTHYADLPTHCKRLQGAQRAHPKGSASRSAAPACCPNAVARDEGSEDNASRNEATLLARLQSPASSRASKDGYGLEVLNEFTDVSASSSKCNFLQWQTDSPLRSRDSI